MLVEMEHHFVSRHAQTVIGLPVGSSVLGVMDIDGDIYLNVMIESEQKTMERRFFVFHPSDEKFELIQGKEYLKYIGTTSLKNTIVIYHVFELCHLVE